MERSVYEKLQYVQNSTISFSSSIWCSGDGMKGVILSHLFTHPILGAAERAILAVTHYHFE